jgi:ubiquinone/menaquinone biosynthesis C-methylase UbiE
MKASKKELFYDQFSEDWEGEINNLETQKRLEIVFGKLFKGIDLRGRRFLEVGCGLGYFSGEASRLGAKVTGVDIGRRLVEKCRKRVPTGKFIVASASELPFKNGSFDIVLCTEVIEHVENQSKVLTEIFRVLKRGGYLAITTPNKLFKPIFSLLTFLGIRPYRGIEKWFFPWELKSIFISKGAVILKADYFNFFYPGKFFDRFEKCGLLKYLMINFGYLAKK